MTDKDKLRKEYVRIFHELQVRKDQLIYNAAQVQELTRQNENLDVEIEVLDEQLEKIEKEIHG